MTRSVLLRQRPRHSVRRDVRRVSGKPAEEISRPGSSPNAESALRSRAPDPARRAGATIRVGSNCIVAWWTTRRIAGEKLPRPDVSRLVGADRQHEVSIHVVAGRRAACRTVCAARDRVLRVPTRRSRSAARAAGARIAFDRAAFEPSAKRRDLSVGQPPLVQELTVAGFRLPGRHHAVARRRDDLRRRGS